MVEQGWLYYVITNGGQVPSIVPAEAEVWYVGRSPSSDDLQSLWLCLNKVAEACHETEASMQLLGGYYDTLPNKG